MNPPPPDPAGEARPEVYAPRHFATRDARSFGGRRFKVITIGRALDREPFASEPWRLVAAEAFAATLAPEMDREGGHFGLGYVVLHGGEAANWPLFDRWVAGGVACQILCRSPHVDPTKFERVARPYMACVWETHAIAHERDAWGETMMDGHPDREGYLRRRMAAGQR